MGYGYTVPFFDNKSKNEDNEYGDEPLHHLARKNKKIYSDQTVRNIQALYIIAAIVWIVLIFLFRLYDTGPLGWLFLVIPIVAFGINYWYASTTTSEVEGEMFQGNFLSFAFLIVVILINWSKVKHKTKLFKILMVALIFIMISLIDIWVPNEQFIYVKHIRTILQTLGLVLLAYGLYIYYREVLVSQ